MVEHLTYNEGDSILKDADNYFKFEKKYNEHYEHVSEFIREINNFNFIIHLSKNKLFIEVFESSQLLKFCSGCIRNYL